MDKLFRTLGKFWFPALTIAAGVFLLIASSGQYAQNMAVKLGSTGILLIGLVSLLFIMDVIKKPIRIALSVVFALGAIYMVNASWNSINDEIVYQKQVQAIGSETKQVLKDVRNAQEAFLLINGRYQTDLDSLIDFVKTGEIPQLKKIGAIPDSVGTETRAREMGLIVKMPEGMTDEQVRQAGLIVRDTVYIPVMEAKFTNEIAMKNRKYPFDLERIKFAPNSGEPWNVRSGTVNIGGLDRPTLLIKDPKPFTTDTLMIGTLDDTHLNGNWKED